jgi:hypothetical protein
MYDKMETQRWGTFLMDRGNLKMFVSVCRKLKDAKHMILGCSETTDMGTYLKINTCMNFQDEMNFRKIIT